VVVVIFSEWKEVAHMESKTGSAGQLQLFGASETAPKPRRGRPPKSPKFLSNPDGGLLAGMDDVTAHLHSGLCQTALPHTRPERDDEIWVRRGLGATLWVTPGYARREEGAEPVQVGVPFGNKGRLILIYLQTLGVISPVVPLGSSMSAWMRSLGMKVTGGERGTIADVKEQVLRIANCSLIIEMTHATTEGVATRLDRTAIAKGLQMWADRPGATNWPTELTLDHEFHLHLRENAVTLDKSAVAQLSSNSLALDIYASLAHWLPRIGAATPMGWASLVKAFGSDGEATFTFGRRLRKVLPSVCDVYKDARVEVGRNGIIMYPSPPPVPQTRIGWESGLKVISPPKNGGAK
jgi:hypothetical protein